MLMPGGRALDQLLRKTAAKRSEECGDGTSDVPMYFLVPRMPPVSRRPWALMPRSHAASMMSWMSKMDGKGPIRYSEPLDLVWVMYEHSICMFR